MVVGVKDSDMDDSDAYVIEDTVVDCALVCFTTRAESDININLLCIIERNVRRSRALLSQTPTCLPYRVTWWASLILRWYLAQCLSRQRQNSTVYFAC